MTTSHHAILHISTQRNSLTSKMWEEFSKTSPAHILHNHTVIDIDTARSLTSWTNTPYEGERVALLSFHTITIPAQNALLKVLEEPANNVKFILITSNKEALLPTLLSRLEEKSSEESGAADTTAAKVFLMTRSSERMKLPFVVELLNAVDEENRKDREAIRTFIISLTKELAPLSFEANHTQTVLQTASYAADPSSSGKSILEYLALLLPEKKD